MKVKLVNTWQQKAKSEVIGATSIKEIPIRGYCNLIDLAPSRYYAIMKKQAFPPKVDAMEIALRAAFMTSGQLW